MKPRWCVLGVLTLGALACCSMNAGAAVYTIDPASSTVKFSVDHLDGTTTGEFKRFTGQFSYDPDPAAMALWKATATIELASIDTHDEVRDEELRSPEVLNAPKYPLMKFVGDKAISPKKNKWVLIGRLTLRGITKRIALDLEILKHGKDIEFSATTRINRVDFGATWKSDPFDADGILISKFVDITIRVIGKPRAPTIKNLQ